jgi:hypothetical protein
MKPARDFYRDRICETIDEFNRNVTSPARLHELLIDELSGITAARKQFDEIALHLLNGMKGKKNEDTH